MRSVIVRESNVAAIEGEREREREREGGREGGKERGRGERERERERDRGIVFTCAISSSIPKSFLRCLRGMIVLHQVLEKMKRVCNQL